MIETSNQTLNYRVATSAAMALAPPGFNPTPIHVVNPSPLVILFGPASSGKTMTLIRLTRFLLKQGYSVIPDYSFCYNQVYQDACNLFLQKCFAMNTAEIASFEMLLVKVIDRQGRIICQLLDAPGPFFFDPNNPQRPWHDRINHLRNLPNKRIWLYFVENSWSNFETRMRYTERIKNHVDHSFKKDRSVLVFSKVDKTGLIGIDKSLYKIICFQYPDVFVPFENRPPLKWFKKYDCQFVPFSSGDFRRLIDSCGNRVVDFIPGADAFPKLLWGAIMRYVSK